MQPPPNQNPGAQGPGPGDVPPPIQPPNPSYPPPGYGAAPYPPPGAQPGYPPPPGQYPYAQPPKKPVPWWVFVLGGCGCFAIFIPILAAILFPVFAQAREKARQTSCMSNEKQMALGILMYCQDYDETLPRGRNWMDGIEPYLGGGKEGDAKEFPALHCPNVSQADSGAFGYAYDSRLSAKTLDKFADPRGTRMIYDSATLTKNASDPGTSMPPEGRHVRGNVAGFLDGHVKWSRVGSSGATAGGPGGE